MDWSVIAQQYFVHLIKHFHQVLVSIKEILAVDCRLINFYKMIFIFECF